VAVLYLDGYVLYRTSLGALPTDIVKSSASVSALLALILVAARTNVVVQARRLIWNDFAKYESVWESMKLAAGCAPALVELCEEVRSIVAALALDGGMQAMQRSSLADEFIRPEWTPSSNQSGTGLRKSWECASIMYVDRLTRRMSERSRANVMVADGCEPVRSLDQLYVQAACVQPILRARVRRWALAFGGLLEIQSNGSCETIVDGLVGARMDRFLPYSSVVGGANERRIVMPRLKSVIRAIEKTQRSYRGVSALFTLTSRPCCCKKEE
jgi:hypothetical protein